MCRALCGGDERKAEQCMTEKAGGGAVSLSLTVNITAEPSTSRTLKTFPSKMAKSPKEKVVHKAMKSIDKLYNEVPGKC